MIERAEKQILLAKNARVLLNLIDDTPIVPGDTHPEFAHSEQAREILNNAEEELRNWQHDIEPITSNAGGLGTNAVPGQPIEHHHLQRQQQTQMEDPRIANVAHNNVASHLGHESQYQSQPQTQSYDNGSVSSQNQGYSAGIPGYDTGVTPPQSQGYSTGGVPSHQTPGYNAGGVPEANTYELNNA